MRKYSVDAYILDVLMGDLVGHDRRPAAFLVYLVLVCEGERKRTEVVPISLQEIAVRTGLGKSTVQAAIRHLVRRGLLDADHKVASSAPSRKVRKPWALG